MTDFAKVTLADVLADGGTVKTGPFGTVLKAAEYAGAGVPIISVGEVDYGSLRLRKDTPHAPVEVTERLPEYVLRAGDIVFGRKGAVDRSAWVKSSEDGWFLGSDGIRLRLPFDVNTRFFAYQFQNPTVREWLLQHASGSTMLSLNQRILERVPLVVPAREVQDAIAEVLGALDDKIAANTKLAETADALAISLVRSHFTGKKQPLNEIASVIMGSSPTGETLNESGLGTVFYQGVRDFGFRFPANRIWTTSPTRMAEPGDTLVSVRAPVGRVNLASERTCIGRGLASVRSTRDTPSTLFHLLQASTDIWEPYEAEGTVFGSINRKQLETIQVPMLETGTALEAEIASIEGTIRISIEENRTLAATRDALLPQLMSGKLRVKDIENTMGEMV
ncbi:restriction endonuclease subunit S [Arthrobacter sp. NPDC055585]